jgi:hypothetical protein
MGKCGGGKRTDAKKGLASGTPFAGGWENEVRRERIASPDSRMITLEVYLFYSIEVEVDLGLRLGYLFAAPLALAGCREIELRRKKGLCMQSLSRIEVAS